MSVRDTSVITYYELLENGYINNRCKLVYEYLKENPDLTDVEIAEGLGFSDPNKVRPRRFDLSKMGLIEESGKRDCTVTNRCVYEWRVKPFVDRKKFYDSKEVKEFGFVSREFRSVNLLQVIVMVHLYLSKYISKRYDAKVLNAEYSKGIYIVNIKRKELK